MNSFECIQRSKSAIFVSPFGNFFERQSYIKLFIVLALAMTQKSFCIISHFKKSLSGDRVARGALQSL